MTECRHRVWGIKTGKAINSAPKLCTLPPTTEAFELNALRALLQVSQWNATMEICPPELNPVDYGYGPDLANKILLPRPIPHGVDPAPESVIKLIRCGCQSIKPCKGGNCKCTSRQMPCTLFCFCGGGDECTNVYKKKHLTHDESFESDIVDDNFDDYSAFTFVPNNVFFFRFMLKLDTFYM